MIDGGFREHFHTIRFLSKQTLPISNYEIIWVEYYRKVADELSACDGVMTIKLDNPPNKEYHSSYCFNAGIEASKGEIIVIPDADIAMEKSFLTSIIKEHEACEKLAMYHYRLDEPKEKHNKVHSYTLDHLRKNAQLNNATNYGGCLSVRKKWLLEINGYDQDPEFSSGFHANGLDVYTRLKNLGLHVSWNPDEFIYHPWHPSTLAQSDKYQRQHSIINKRQLNLSYLPNYGLNPDKNKANKDTTDDKILKQPPNTFDRLKNIFQRNFS